MTCPGFASSLSGVALSLAVVLLVSCCMTDTVTCWLLQTVHEKCFDKCVTRPGTSLSGSEQGCMSRCFDRYAEV